MTPFSAWMKNERGWRECQKISEEPDRNVDGSWVRKAYRVWWGREFWLSKGPVKIPIPWSLKSAYDTGQRAETGMHTTDASEKLLLCSLPFPVSPRISAALPLPSLHDWAGVTTVTVVIPAAPFPLWSGPFNFCRSPELFTLYFPALSSEMIIPRSMFLYQTTVTSSTHQIRNSGSSKEHPFTYVGVFLDSWKINASPEFSEER